MRVQAAAAAGFPFMQAPRNGWSVILSLSVKTVQAWLFLLRQVESAGEESRGFTGTYSLVWMLKKPWLQSIVGDLTQRT